MGNQMTEMLKGTLEGIVLAVLATQPAYGYEITARLREQGFSDLVEGTVYALLIRIEQRGFVDVRESPVRKRAAAQGVFAQPARARTARRVLADVELPLGTDRKAPAPQSQQDNAEGEN